MALSTNQNSNLRAPANHRATSKYQLKISSQRSRVEPESEVELIPVDFTLDGLRDSFKNMQKAVSSPIKTELKGVGESNWYQTVSSCLAYASMCAELIQVEQVSVLVALESGWDLTSVLVALTEIILDPTYRTIDGFQTIIEREFLSFGHRFRNVHHRHKIRHFGCERDFYVFRNHAFETFSFWDIFILGPSCV